ncbi:MAG: hypothetical protein M1814_001388 [Vezdaea aestivalis]|nr:MAG: hypothetical protein M1814_001388 [Vezdaea aestivalis]
MHSTFNKPLLFAILLSSFFQPIFSKTGQAFCQGPVPPSVQDSAPRFAHPPYNEDGGLQALCTGSASDRMPHLNCECGVDAVDLPPGQVPVQLPNTRFTIWKQNPSQMNPRTGVGCVSRRLRDSMFFDGRNLAPLDACLALCQCVDVKPDGWKGFAGLKTLRIAGRLPIDGGSDLGSSGGGPAWTSSSSSGGGGGGGGFWDTVGGGRELKGLEIGSKWKLEERRGQQVLVKVAPRRRFGG